MNLWQRQNLRREYLRRTRKVYATHILWTLVYLSITVVFALCSLKIGNLPTYGWFWDGLLEIAGGTALIVVVIAALIGVCGFCSTKDVVKSIPYVPPVTPNTLPAEEVLVRGSQEPTQEQSTVLLRAAGENTDRPEEMLRASVGKE